MNFPPTFYAALARSFHPQMEPKSIEYLGGHFADALKEIGWTAQPLATARAVSGQTQSKGER